MLPSAPGPIGVFDSGYGGLTILKAMRSRLPGFDYLYLGDNARAPYGSRSFGIVYEFTLQAVKALFERGCHLVILACNTASAKALRSIQQHDLQGLDPDRRVLGVIRPTVEALGAVSKSRHVGVLGTPGTIRSRSYDMEAGKLYSDLRITGQACPMWVPLVENGEASGPGADYFVSKYIGEIMRRDPQIDTLVLGCTHYPLLMPKIRQCVPEGTRVIAQGELVADSLADYLERHPEMAAKCTRGGTVRYLTTESPANFDALASLFMQTPVRSSHIEVV